MWSFFSLNLFWVGFSPDSNPHFWSSFCSQNWQRTSQTPWRKLCINQKPLEKISNFRYVTTSIHPVALIHKVYCQVSWQYHRKQLMHRFFLSFFFFKLTLPFKATSLLCSDTSSRNQLLSPAHMSRKHLPQRKWHCPGMMGTVFTIVEVFPLHHWAERLKRKD